MRGREAEQLELSYGDGSQARELDQQWRSSAEAEQRSRTRFAQATIHPDDVESAVEAARASLGRPEDVADFTRDALHELGATVSQTTDGFDADLTGAPFSVRELFGDRSTVPFARDHPAPTSAVVLHRTDARVAGLARYVVDSALDPDLPSSSRPARRCGVVVSSDVSTQTTALLVRFRTHLTVPTGGGDERVHLAEEARTVAFTGAPASPTWLQPDEVDRLLHARPDANIGADVARNAIANVLAALPLIAAALNEQAGRIAEQLRADHVAVRLAARGDRAGSLSIRNLAVTPQLPVDVLGVYVFRPMGGGR